MARKKRLIAGLVLAAACMPGTWARTEVPRGPSWDIALVQVEGASETVTNGWRLEGVWQAEADTLMFGGFSALLTLGEDKLRAFSDRGTRFTLTEPGKPSAVRNVVRQLVRPDRSNQLFDIESATRDPETGAYWLGYEHVHTVHRFTVASEIDNLRDLDDEVSWTENSGAEAMVRLQDGRFLILPVREDEGVIFAGDPIKGGDFATFGYDPPAEGFEVTDVTQLPDGRLLLLLRTVAWNYPPFASKIAIADLPQADQKQSWSPTIALDLADVVPPENYEGIAVRAKSDGTVTVWLISDDNFAATQRTLIAKLAFDPDWKPSKAKGARKAARP